MRVRGKEMTTDLMIKNRNNICETFKEFDAIFSVSFPASLENFLFVINDFCKQTKVWIDFNTINDLKKGLKLIKDAINQEMLPICQFEEYLEQGKVFLLFKTGIVIFKVKGVK